MKQKIIYTLFFLLPIYLKAQTCILILSYNDTIIIGADSKAGVRTFATGFKVKTSLTNREDCKIFQEKGVFYVASGRWAVNILKFGKESILKQTEFKDTLQFLKKEAITELERDLENKRLSDNESFLEEYRRKIFAHSAFVWFYKGIPKCYGFTFKIISDSTEKVKIKIEDTIFKLHQPKNQLFIVPLGTISAISNMYLTERFWINNQPLEYGMNKLLTIQAKATPNTVGAPFSIVRITKKGVKWHTKGKCK